MKLKVSEEEAQLICWGDHDDYQVIRERITGKGRWDTTSEIIIKSIDGKYYCGWKTVGSTEYQDTREYCTEWDEVEPYEKTVIEFKLKESV